jgi:hypothetical protein
MLQDLQSMDNLEKVHDEVTAFLDQVQSLGKSLDEDVEVGPRFSNLPGLSKLAWPAAITNHYSSG